MAHVLSLRDRLMFSGAYATLAICMIAFAYIQSKHEQDVRSVSAVSPRASSSTAPVVAEPAHVSGAMPKLLVRLDQDHPNTKFSSVKVVSWNADLAPVQLSGKSIELRHTGGGIDIVSSGRVMKSFGIPDEIGAEGDADVIKCPAGDEKTCRALEWFSNGLPVSGALVHAVLKNAKGTEDWLSNRLYFYGMKDHATPFLIVELKKVRN
jgi:hypothetical protein